MKNLQKSKISIILIIAVISMVFAGLIYPSFAFALNQTHTTAPTNISAYLANKQYEIINDTTSHPISYDEKGQVCDVSIQYSIDYDFDLRVKYHLSWSNDKSANNVILNFVDRDSWIVDSAYIFHTSTIPAGTGKLNIIGGVDFITDLSDGYVDENLTIVIDEVKIAPSNLSETDLALANGTSEAGTAWLNYKNRESSTNAYVMVYNHRYNYANGIAHSGPETAYSKVINDSKQVTSAKWAGGNRYYSGVGLYVITGTQALTLKIKATANWILENSSSTGGLIFVTNIQYNYSNNWTHLEYDSNKLFETMEYELTIPALSTFYIDAVDSIEITSAGYTQGVDYTNYRLTTDLITINNITFKFDDLGSDTAQANYVYGDKEVLGSYITNAGLSKANQQTKENVQVVAKSYNNGLFEYMAEPITQTFETSLTLINNTDKIQTLEFTLNPLYHIGNAAIAFTDSNGDRATSFADNVYYSIESQCGEYVEASNVVLSHKLYPNQLVKVPVVYTVQATMQDKISTDTNSKTDVWVEIGVANVSSSEASQISATDTQVACETEITNDGTNSYIVLSIKNNTNKKLSGVSISANVQENYTTIQSTPASTEPSNWKSSFWKYYTYSSSTGVYTQVTELPSSFTSGVYYLSETQQSSVSKSSQILLNSFVYTDGKYQNSSLSILPNEKIEFAKLLINDSNIENYSTEYTASVTFSSVNNDVELVKTGDDTAYLINNSAKSYFVRMSGALSTTDDKFLVGSTDGKIYYNSIIRPNQIVHINLDNSTFSSLEFVLAGDTYIAGSSGTLSGWDSSVITYFDNLFN